MPTLTCVGEKMRPGHPCRAPGPAWPRPHPQRCDTQWPLRTSVSRVLEPLPAALRLLWAASVLPRKERSTWPRPPGARLPGAQSQSTARGGILGGGAHACSGPAAHRGEGAAVPEAHAARLSAPAARRPGDRQRPQHSGLPLLPHVPSLLGTCSLAVSPCTPVPRLPRGDVPGLLLPRARVKSGP